MTATDQIHRGLPVTQKRSRRTYEALIAAGFALLDDVEFESISIADIARKSGYSVGAFYARFASKDEYFEAMVALHLRERAQSRDTLFETMSPEALVETVIADMVGYYWRRRRFWRAVLLRSTNDAEFWAPILKAGQEYIDLLTARIQTHVGRELRDDERSHIAFAIHVVFGVLNNRIVNRPQPSLAGSDGLVPDLIRAFRLVSGLDAISSSSPTASA